MSVTEAFDPAAIKFESTVYPTEADMKLWDSLSPDEQRAVVSYSLDQAGKSGIADPETFEARMIRARSRAPHGSPS